MKNLLDLAVRFAREAGDSTLRYFRSDDSMGLESKSDGSPVTLADRGAEELLRRRIEEHRPDDGILGEEFGEKPGSNGHLWILDPIDGTKSFVRGVPLYGTLVGVEIDGLMQVGVAYFPALREMMFAAHGLGATWITDVGLESEQSRPARVSGVESLDEALFAYTSVGGFARAGKLELFERVRSAARLDRGWCDCYGHMLVATGRAEIMIDPRMASWDCAALQPIVEEAGGSFTALDGRPTHRGGSAVSTNAALAVSVARLLR